MALIGAGIGAAIAWLLFNGNTVTLGDSVGSVVFKMQVTPGLLLAGVLLACSVGFIGGLLPGRTRGAASSSDRAAGRVGRQRSAALGGGNCSFCASSSICSIASGAPCIKVRFRYHGPTNGGSQKSGSISMT